MLFSLFVDDGSVAEDDAVGAVEATRGVGVPRELRAVARCDVACGGNLLDLLNGFAVDPNVHQVGRVLEVLGCELTDRAKPQLGDLGATSEDVSPAGSGRDRRVAFLRGAVL